MRPQHVNYRDRWEQKKRFLIIGKTAKVQIHNTKPLDLHNANIKRFDTQKIHEK